MSTKITLLPLDEVLDLFHGLRYEILKVGVLHNGDLGLVVHYYDRKDEIVKNKVIRPTSNHEKTKTENT